MRPDRDPPIMSPQPAVPFPTRHRHSHPRTALWLAMLAWALVGFSAGCLNGLLGAAGGIVLVAVIPYLPTVGLLSHGRLAPRPIDRRDVLTTALCVMLPTSAVSLLTYLAQGIRPDADTLWVIALPTVAGGLLGAALLDRLPREALRKGFALLIVISGLRMLL